MTRDTPPKTDPQPSPPQDEERETTRRYFRYLKLERNAPENTLMAYRHDLRYLTDYCHQLAIPLASARLEDLERFAASLHDHVSARSQARILSGVRSFYHFLQLDGYIQDDPTELLPSPSIGQHLPEYLSLEEVDALEGSIDLSKWEGQRNKAIIEVLFSCGLRVSELVHLRLSDLFLEEGVVRVVGKGDKERLVPISKSAIHELKLWFMDRDLMRVQKGEEDFVFLNRRGSHLSRVMILIMIKKQAQEAGIRKVISPHTLRHSFATAMLRGGADLRAIQAMLGHEDISTTEIYTHLETSDLRREILEHHPRNLRGQTDGEQERNP